MSLWECFGLGSFAVGLACVFDLLRAARDLFSFSMSLMASSCFVDFFWGSLSVDFVRARAGMTMRVKKTGEIQTPPISLWHGMLRRAFHVGHALGLIAPCADNVLSSDLDVANVRFTTMTRKGRCPPHTCHVSCKPAWFDGDQTRI